MSAGARLEDARAAMVMVHGRGASAASILTLAPEIGRADVAYLAPEAAGGAWYPYSFLMPIERNEPGISSGIQAIRDVVAMIEAAGIPARKIILLGFSQGACLTLEYTARNVRRYGGVAGLSGGLIGPDGTPREYPGSLDGTPVFLGCSDIDSHIPKERVEQTGEVFERLGASVDIRLYKGMDHTINEDEIAVVQGMIDVVTG
jgi:predicted esterase